MHSVEEIPQPTYRKSLLKDRFCLATPLDNKFSSTVSNTMKAMFTQYTMMPAVLQIKTVG